MNKNKLIRLENALIGLVISGSFGCGMANPILDEMQRIDPIHLEAISYLDRFPTEPKPKPEIIDINRDGKPEYLVYVFSNDKGEKMSVFYEVRQNGRKVLNQIYIRGPDYLKAYFDQYNRDGILDSKSEINRSDIPRTQEEKKTLPRMPHPGGKQKLIKPKHDKRKDIRHFYHSGNIIG